MADLIQALQSTSVPTFLVFAGIITIFLALGARFSPIEIPRERRVIFGFLGAFCLFGGILLFAWNPRNVSISLQPTMTPTIEVSPKPTHTIISSPMPSVASTPIPTHKPESTATATLILQPTLANTNMPSATPTEKDDVFEIVVVQTITTDVDVYYGPSTENSRAGLLKLGDEVEAIGKVRGAIWIEIVLENGETGWVDGNKVKIIEGIIDDLPLTWPRQSTQNGTEASTGAICSLNAFAVQDDFGNVSVRWDNTPVGTRWLHLTVTALLDREFEQLLEPQIIDATDLDTAAKGFELGTWRFDPNDPNWKGFSPDSTYRYVLVALDEIRNTLCTVQGEFIR